MVDLKADESQKKGLEIKSAVAEENSEGIYT
jgi:hypothetical protein